MYLSHGINHRVATLYPPPKFAAWVTYCKYRPPSFEEPTKKESSHIPWHASLPRLPGVALKSAIMESAGGNSAEVAVCFTLSVAIKAVRYLVHVLLLGCDKFVVRYTRGLEGTLAPVQRAFS